MHEISSGSNVRSLLAKFESNQNNATSPPSRGRSPVNSDNSGSGRPLSKVRASFIAVEKAAHSPTATTFAAAERPLQRTTSWGVQSVGSSEDAKAGRSLGSSPQGDRPEISPKVVEQVANIVTSSKEAAERIIGQKDSAKENSLRKVANDVPGKPSSPSDDSKPKSAPASKTATKRPPNINTTKKPVSKPMPSTGAKSTAGHRSPTAANSNSSSTSKTVRPSNKSVAGNLSGKESVKSPGHRPGRPALSSIQSTARTTRARSSTPVRATTKSTTSKSHPASPDASENQTKSPSRQNRRPVSMTAPSLSTSRTASASRSPTRTAHTTSGLSRKPSSTLKSTNGAVHPRITAATNASVRKQSSRLSLANNASNDRPGSRASTVGTKPVADGFLARLTRPTASSAGKAHEKIEVKSPPRPAKSAKAPPKKTVEKEPHRTHAIKGKGGSEKNSQKENSTENHEKLNRDSNSHLSEPLKEYQTHLETLNVPYEQPVEEPIPDLTWEPVRERPGYPRAPKPRFTEVEDKHVPATVNEPAEKPSEKPVEATTEKEVSPATTEPPVQSSADPSTEQKPAEPPTGDAMENTSERPVDQGKHEVELPVECAVEKQSTETQAQSAEEKIELSIENTVESSTEKPVGPNVQKTESTADEPLEASLTQPEEKAELSADKPLESAIAVSAEKPEQPIDIPLVSTEESNDAVSSAPEHPSPAEDAPPVNEGTDYSTEPPKEIAPESVEEADGIETPAEKAVDTAVTAATTDIAPATNDVDIAK
ncbi:hypothetical protein MPDQ_000547 [Monascus purpureus]|uniref:Uncharacterized protein n=1 Tax=Monascus purpureus TaxID=5098 RepID=A0A507R3V9_MONPU|nr:hypothetical protein MPDQ_000547 [Monascus purpureus]